GPGRCLPAFSWSQDRPRRDLGERLRRVIHPCRYRASLTRRQPRYGAPCSPAPPERRPRRVHRYGSWGHLGEKRVVPQKRVIMRVISLALLNSLQVSSLTGCTIDSHDECHGSDGLTSSATPPTDPTPPPVWPVDRKRRAPRRPGRSARSRRSG